MAGTGVGVGISQRVALTTIAKWSRKLHTETIDKFLFLRKMREHGNIEYGCHGGEVRWVVKYRDHDISGYIDGAPKQFQKIKTTFNAALPWRGYESSDVITYQEKLEHGGTEAVVEIFNNREQLIRDGLQRQLGREWFKDGNASGNERRFHGIESFGSSTGQTANDELATTPNDSYAGTSTSYTSLKSGAVNGTDEEYGVWSPVIVNTNRTPTSGTLRNWENYSDEYIRLGLIEADRGGYAGEQIDLILLTKLAFRQLQNVLDDKERLAVSRGKSEMAKFGFGAVMSIDGVDCMWDRGIAATDGSSKVVSGYGFNMSKVKLKLLGGKKSKSLFTAKVTWNSDYASTRIWMACLGNLCFISPRHFIKFAAIT